MKNSLWPYMRMAINASALGSLQSTLNGNKPHYVSTIDLTHLDIGHRAPQLGGVKIVPSEDGSITLEMDIKFAAGEKQLMVVRLLSNVGVTANICLRELCISGVLRITLSSLYEKWPCFR